MPERPPNPEHERLPQIESREALVNAACERLLAKHAHAHADLSFHNVEHPKAVMGRVRKIADALEVAEESDEFQVALLAAAGHDVIMKSSIDAEGKLTRNVGGSGAMTTTPENAGNEFASAQAIINTLRELDPEQTYWDEDFANHIVAAVDATVPDVKPEPIPEENMRVRQPRTDALIDLSHYALTQDERPHALAIRRPYLSHDSDLPAVMLALADLAQIGAEDFETFRQEGNAEFRELQVRFRTEQLPELDHLTPNERAEFVDRIFKWWRLQVLLPMQQQQLFIELFDSNTDLLMRPSEQREQLYNLFSKFEANALHAAEFYEKMQEEFGHLTDPNHHDVDSTESFRALLAYMGYEIPEPAQESM